MLREVVFSTPEWLGFREDTATTWDIWETGGRETCQLRKRVSLCLHGSATWDIGKGGIKTKWWSFSCLRNRMHERLRQEKNSLCPDKAPVPLSYSNRWRMIDNCVGKACKRKGTRGVSSRLWVLYFGLFWASMFTSQEIWIQVRPTAGLKSEQPGTFTWAPTQTRSSLCVSSLLPSPSLFEVQRTLCLYIHIWISLLPEDTYALWTESWVEVGE